MLEKVTETFHRSFHQHLAFGRSAAKAASEVTGHVRRTFTSPQEYSKSVCVSLFGEKGSIYLTPGGSTFSARARFYDKYLLASRIQTRVFVTPDELHQGQIIQVEIRGFAKLAMYPLFLLYFAYKPGQTQPHITELTYDPHVETKKDEERVR